MRVVFSPDIFRAQRYGGVSRYAVELHRALLRRGVDSKIMAGLHRNALLCDVDRVLGFDVDWVRPPRVRQIVTKAADRVAELGWDRCTSSSAVYHKSYYSKHSPSDRPVVVTVYDMIHERFRADFHRRDIALRAKESSCRSADIVLTVSETTRLDLLERFALPAEKVMVTPLGVRPIEPAVLPRPVGSAPFILFVGDRTPRYKNWPMLVSALQLANTGLELVCFGAPFTSQEWELLRAAGLQDLSSTAFGDDHTLTGFYRQATALAYPSLWEGFGLPPLEAMAQGCPVVAAQSGSIPEVLGEDAIMFDPTDVESVAYAIVRVASAGPSVERLIRRGRARAASFTWDRTAHLTEAAYRVALST